MSRASNENDSPDPQINNEGRCIVWSPSRALPGSQANVVVANGDPLDVKTDVKQVFIAGREVPMTDPQVRLRDEYSK